MDDGAADRTLLGVGLDLGHQIVADLGLDLGRALDVDVILMGDQIGDLLGGHQPDIGLGLGQRHPKTAQQSPLLGFAPDHAHGLPAIAPGDR